MSKITIEDEQTLRAEIVAYLATEPLAGHVFNRRRMISSRNHFARTLGVAIGDKTTTEVRFTELELLNVEDSPDEGFDDCPVAVLTYNVHSFHEFADERADGSNSDRDFNDWILTARRMILDKRTFVDGRAVVVDSLTPPEGQEYTQFGSDTLTDCKGYFKDQLLKVNYYDASD